MAACGSALSLSRKRLGPVCTESVPNKRRLPENPVTPPTARTSYTEVKWTVPHMQLPAPHMQLRHVDDDGDPTIGTSPFDLDGDYCFDNSDVFDQKVAVAVAPPSRLLDRYGAPTLDAEDVLDDAQPPAFVQFAPLAFHADDESDGEDSDAGSHAARAVRKAEYSSDDDSEEEEEEEDAEYDFSETESAQSRSSDEELDMDGSSSDDDDDDDDDEEQVFPEAWSDGDDE